MLVKRETEYDYSVLEGIRLEDMRPLRNHLLVRWHHKVETKGGVLLPQNRQRLNFMRGTVLRQGFCDGEWYEGETILFDGLCEKEWLGGQNPPGRDVTFFMRVEDVFAIILQKEEGGAGGLKMVNGRVLIKPDQEAKEKAGLLMVNSEQKGEAIWGMVVFADTRMTDLRPGDRVLYDKQAVTEVKLGDFSGEVHHCVSEKAIEAAEEKGVIELNVN